MGAVVGGIEQHGIAPIPVAEQTSRPRDLFRLCFGGANTFATIVLGTLPIAYGLGFWAALSATAVGVVAGALVLAPMALFGPVTRTNNAVSSGAHFGVVGRSIGSLLSLLTAVTFFAISVWVSGDAIAGAALRLTGSDGGAALRAAAYGLIAVAVVLVCVHGYRFLLLVNRVAVVLGTVIVLLGGVAFAVPFDPAYPGTGDYALDGFWSTWVLAALTAMANPVSFGAFLGDWSRYIPASVPRGRLLAAPLLAQLATLLPFGFGVATATLVPDPDDYVAGLTAASPTWYAVALVVVALIGGLSTGTTALYGTGLDFSSLVPRLTRVRATVLVGIPAVGLVFVGSFALDVVGSINAFATLIVLGTSPWMVVLMTGCWIRGGYYDPADLQVFNEGRRGGRYWYRRGVNWRATTAWLISVVLGLLTANTPVIAGPLRDVAGGPDISLPCALLTAAVLHPLLLVLFPEPAEVFGPRGPRGPFARGRAVEPVSPGRCG